MATIRGNNSANLLKGTGAADRINGRGGDDTMNGGGGDDVLDGGAGVDRLNGGAGDDTLVWDAADTLVNGAAGEDTLWVTSGDLDLTAVADDKIRNVEVIDLTEGDHTLTLARSDVVALSSTTNTLRVEGDAGDAVATTDAGWLLSVNVVIGGETYAQYVNDTAILQVDIDIDHSGIDSTVAAIQLANLNGTNGFRLDNIDARAVDGSFMGWRDVSVASAGDLNGDGFSDLIIGSQNADPGGEAFAGASYVVFGKAHGFASSIDLATLDGTNGFRMEGIDAYDRSGATVASAGDVNGDGFDDLIIRAWEAGPRGESYVVFGKASGFGTNFDFATLDGENGFRLDRGGLSVASAGDVNGDGFADLIIGGIEGRKSYVVFGKASGFDPSVDLATLNGTNGFRLDAADPLGLTGSSVASAGDVNGDGFDDLFIGAPNVGNTRPPFLGGLGPGASYVVFGKASSFANSIDLAALDGSNGFRLDGIGASDGSGRSVSSAGDVNGDGFADLIIVATNADSYAGASYVVFGKASGFESNINL